MAPQLFNANAITKDMGLRFRVSSRPLAPNGAYNGGPQEGPLDHSLTPCQRLACASGATEVTADASALWSTSDTATAFKHRLACVVCPPAPPKKNTKKTKAGAPFVLRRP